MIKKKLL